MLPPWTSSSDSRAQPQASPLKTAFPFSRSLHWLGFRIKFIRPGRQAAFPSPKDLTPRTVTRNAPSPRKPLLGDWDPLFSRLAHLDLRFSRGSGTHLCPVGPYWVVTASEMPGDRMAHRGVCTRSLHTRVCVTIPVFCPVCRSALAPGVAIGPERNQCPLTVY